MEADYEYGALFYVITDILHGDIKSVGGNVVTMLAFQLVQRFCLSRVYNSVGRANPDPINWNTLCCLVGLLVSKSFPLMHVCLYFCLPIMHVCLYLGGNTIDQLCRLKVGCRLYFLLSLSLS